MEAARQDCDFVAVSIFVNPTQFGPNEDLSRYPRPLSKDLEICEAEQVQLVFHPEPETVYPPGFCSFVEVQGLSDVFEGKFRPGHFRGVTTVVLKLLNTVQPDIAYFGQKDFQQQLIVRRMCHDLDVPCEIRVCPTIREPDGLALSSRNVYLNHAEREAAGALSRCLFHARQSLAEGETDLARLRQQMWEVLTTSPLVQPEYATIVDSETMEEVSQVTSRMTAIVAARVGQTRLIDNLPLEVAG